MGQKTLNTIQESLSLNLPHKNLANKDLFSLTSPVLPKSSEKQSDLSVNAKKTPKKLVKSFGRRSLDHINSEASRTIFVGNLPNTIERRELKKLFRQCGNIENIRIRNLVLESPTSKVTQSSSLSKKTASNKLPPPKVSRSITVLRGNIKKDEKCTCNAFVIFSDPETAIPKALRLNGTIFKDRHIIVTRADFESTIFPHRTSIFLGNLAYDTEEEELWKFFEENDLSAIKRIRLVRDSETRVGKGFGYVEFLRPEHAEQALKLREANFKGRPIRITHVQKSAALTNLEKTRRGLRGEKRLADVTSDDTLPNKRRRIDKDNDSKKVKSEKISSASKKGKNIEKRPSWMGEVINPRRKMPIDLRHLVDGSKPSRKRK